MKIERKKGAAMTRSKTSVASRPALSQIMAEGDIEAGAWTCGMVAGLIHDIPSVQS